MKKYPIGQYGHVTRNEYEMSRMKYYHQPCFVTVVVTVDVSRLIEPWVLDKALAKIFGALEKPSGLSWTLKFGNGPKWVTRSIPAIAKQVTNMDELALKLNSAIEAEDRRATEEYEEQFGEPDDYWDDYDLGDWGDPRD